MALIAGLAIPLEVGIAMLPRRARAAAAVPSKRLLLIGRNLGLHSPFFFPDTPGLGYESTRYLRHLDDHRGKFTVFSGIPHLKYTDHRSEPGLFTGVNWDRIKEPAKEHHKKSRRHHQAAVHRR